MPIYLPRTVITGQDATAATREATLPRKNSARPVRPWVPMTIRSAFFDLAARAISSCTTPSYSSATAVTPALRAWAWSTLKCFSAYLRAEFSRSS
jgi:hypothetical protein